MELGKNIKVDEKFTQFLGKWDWISEKVVKFEHPS